MQNGPIRPKINGPHHHLHDILMPMDHDCREKDEKMIIRKARIIKLLFLYLFPSTLLIIIRKKIYLPKKNKTEKSIIKSKKKMKKKSNHLSGFVLKNPKQHLASSARPWKLELQSLLSSFLLSLLSAFLYLC